MICTLKRCSWGTTDIIYLDYHDNEWGRPVHDDKKLFEMLILEGAQAGLSWITILKRRNGYKRAFDNFDVQKVAKYTEKKVQKLIKDPGIIRNKLKIRSAIKNAKVFIDIQTEFGSFDKYIWEFVDNNPILNKFKSIDLVPAKTELSDKISKDLKKRGMSFVGSTIIYAYMQAIGLVNDHVKGCFLYKSK